MPSWSRLAHTLTLPPSRRKFDPGVLVDLPAPARRYFERAIEPGTAIPRSVRLDTRFRMRFREGAEPVDLSGEEVLAPPRGFVWRARGRMGRLPVRIRDHYLDGRGAVRVSLLGLIPVVRSGGGDVSRSARGRLAAEAIWLPSCLLPGPGVEWSAAGEDRARVRLTVDGEGFEMLLWVDGDGRLRELHTSRWGDVGVDAFRQIPFGVEVSEDATFDGITIPARVRGGWWFGSDRYDRQAASLFEIVAADFG